MKHHHIAVLLAVFVGLALFGRPLAIDLEASSYANSFVSVPPFSRGDVFAAVGSGQVRRFSPDGALLQTLDTGCKVSDEKSAFYVKDGKAYAICGQGVLRMVRFELDGVETSAAEFAAQYGTAKFEFNR